jgi:flagellin-specific chaperone FliS
MFVNNMINVSETIGKLIELNNKMKVDTEVFNIHDIIQSLATFMDLEKKGVIEIDRNDSRVKDLFIP